MAIKEEPHCSANSRIAHNLLAYNFRALHTHELLVRGEGLANVEVVNVHLGEVELGDGGGERRVVEWIEPAPGHDTIVVVVENPLQRADVLLDKLRQRM